MKQRWVCVHGHFYQPPRENPWLDEIEPQPSAAPFPDWNARITAECYRPNAAARIVDGGGTIIDIVDNYARMSWNFGPTLATYLARHAPDVHAALVAADAASVARFGRGAALAQAHGHLIMPLCPPRERRIQVRWGLADFRHRFGRDAEGMWLPECAVDTATLETLAAEGVGFTILAPHQAARVRPPGGEWRDVAVAEPGRGYRCPLPSGRSIDLFFYDGPLARAVAFERVLDDGAGLARRLVASASGDAPLGHIATDGETYGHHHRYGDMALAYALATIDRGEHAGVALTNYAAFRVAHPPTWEVAIRDDTSWSCAHGVERWRSDCGCNSGGRPGWNQAWRRPLRDALDWLRDRADDAFDHLAPTAYRDPETARDAYALVVADGDAAREPFLAAHLAPGADRERALAVMELARHAMAMYTSCGWFFDDLGGIETVQVLTYAARVCELIEGLGGPRVEPGFVDRLAAARSNDPAIGDGRALWARAVVPARVDLAHAVASQALVVAVTGDTPAELTSGPTVTFDAMERRTAGAAATVDGVATAADAATGARRAFAFAVVHAGDHRVTGGVGAIDDLAAWDRDRAALGAAFAASVEAAARWVTARFPAGRFSLATLVPRDRAAVLATLTAAPVAAADACYQAIYDEHLPVIRELVTHRLAVPAALALAARHVLSQRLEAELARESPQVDAVRALLIEAGEVAVELDTPQVAYLAGAALHRAIAAVGPDHDAAALERLARLAEVAVRMRSPVDLWDAQNATWRIARATAAAWRSAAASGDTHATRCWAALDRLARAIRVAIG